MSFRTQILEDLDPEFAGLKKDPCLTWLDDALQALNVPASVLTVKGFLHGMKDRDALPGYLLEVETAWQCLQCFPQGSVRTEVTEGTAKTPCDVVVTLSDFRVDMQCKAVQSVLNEFQIEELSNWLKENFGPPEVTGFFDLQVVSSATQDDIEPFKAWLLENPGALNAPNVIDFPDAENPLIRVETHQPNDGSPPMTTFSQGLLWGPVDGIGLAAAEDIEDLRGSLISRFKKSRKTFGFIAGPKQANLVVVSVPSLGLTDEESLADALYGEPGYILEGVDGKVTAFGSGRDSATGLFSSGKFEYVSGVVLVGTESPCLGSSSMVLYPHNKHLDAAKRLLGYSGWRLPQNRAKQPILHLA